MNLPDRAEIVIIGGGAVGCGVAYSLATDGDLAVSGKTAARVFDVDDPSRACVP